MFVSFASYKRVEMAKRLSVRHRIGVPLPQVVSAKFSDNLGSLVITFDGIINQLNNDVKVSGKSCFYFAIATFINSSLSSF